MFINWNMREINLKIVYYGPALSGKTTNLEYIHSRTNPEFRGELVSLKTSGGRTLFFDFMQLELGPIKGLKPKFNLYTVPGQPCYVASRRLVLQGADAVVYVADSQISRLKANMESMRNLKRNLQTLRVNPRDFPLVLQYNKRDLPNRAPIGLLRMQLAHDGIPQFQSVATHGIGVIETLRAAINLAVSTI
jgi:signal recognition particle receptor subunit beta